MFRCQRHQRHQRHQKHHHQLQQQLRQPQESRMQAHALIASTTMIISILLVQLFLLSASSAADPTASELRQQQQHRGYQSASGSVFDEEINLEHLYDYDKTSTADTVDGSSTFATSDSATLNSPQIAPDPASLSYNDEARGSWPSSSSSSSSSSSGDYNGDPFATTFEDYLREAGSRSSNQAPNEPLSSRVSLIDEDLPLSSLTDPPPSQPTTTHHSGRDASVASGSDGSTSSAPMRQRETPIIDYIFPAAPAPAPAAASSTSSGSSALSGQRVEEENKNLKQNNEHLIASNKSSDSNNDLLLNEIKLLFAWRQKATSKCSKPCGKGYQMNHLFCMDMKYDVRVEDELCLKSSMPKPAELSEEPCNQIDCPPQWISIESTTQAPNCANLTATVAPSGAQGKPNTDVDCRSALVYKRAQCAMVDRTGAIVHLDEQRCSDLDHSQRQHRNHFPDHHKVEPHRSTSNYDDESVDLAEFMNTDVESFNKILADSSDSQAESSSSSMSTEEASASGSATAMNPHNEPFLEAGPWSACFGDKCGQLGKRFRRLTCRIYLSRSARYADLPESNCQGAAQPDIQEPCFIDCGGARETNNNITAHPHLQVQEAAPVHGHSQMIENRSPAENRPYQGDEVLDMVSVVDGVHIEQKVNYVLVFDPRSGRKEMIPNEQLIGMPLKVLSKTMVGFPKEVLFRVKQLRRTIRNNQRASVPSSSVVCRHQTMRDQRRLEQRSKLERRNVELVEELRRKEARIAELEKKVLSCEFDNSILAA